MHWIDHKVPQKTQNYQEYWKLGEAVGVVGGVMGARAEDRGVVVIGMVLEVLVAAVVAVMVVTTIVVIVVGVTVVERVVVVFVGGR